jgi:hypothetical protein
MLWLPVTIFCRWNCRDWLRKTASEPYLGEACPVAGLDHPDIVTGDDVGSTPEFPFIVVSK